MICRRKYLNIKPNYITTTHYIQIIIRECTHRHIAQTRTRKKEEKNKEIWLVSSVWCHQVDGVASTLTYRYTCDVRFECKWSGYQKEKVNKE